MGLDYTNSNVYVDQPINHIDVPEIKTEQKAKLPLDCDAKNRQYS